ncbi:hypothetical protein AVEN_166596-1 [Araneus ventricosus]|uniref:Uncharacterized protein n=1 Tax=Araneus ventricosus TaxID=182803 RepID=A0A4Y2KIZ6_ARAVE|nr:hypothetical protein AVEN_166596-1 [Araneus ventricosus]
MSPAFVFSWSQARTDSTEDPVLDPARQSYQRAKRPTPGKVVLRGATRCPPHHPKDSKLIEQYNFVKSIKDVCKNVNKGYEMAVFEFTSGENDQYQMGRYISSNEAVRRVLNFLIYERHTTMIHLSVHLEIFREFTSRQKMLLNGPKRLRKQRSHFSSDFPPEMSLHVPYCTMKYPSTTLGTMDTRHGNVENKSRLY